MAPSSFYLVIICIFLSVTLSKVHIITNYDIPTSPIECGDQVPGDTFNSLDGCDYYHFTVTKDQTNIWFSSCGSDYDTYLSIHNSSGYVIATNDNSVSCGEQAILKFLDAPSGDYLLNISGKHETDIGEYVITMICDNFTAPSYPELNCNHIYSKPAGICQIDDYFMDLNDPENDEQNPDEIVFLSRKYDCDESGAPIESLYNSSLDCSGYHINLSLPVNGSFQCNQRTPCRHALMQYREDCNDNATLYEFMVITGVCLQNVKWECDEEESVLTKHLYDDEQCSEISVYGPVYGYKLGCYTNEIKEFIMVENITCRYYDYNGSDDFPSNKYALLWLGMCFILLCFIFGGVYCRKKKREEYKAAIYGNSYKMIPESMKERDSELIQVKR